MESFTDIINAWPSVQDLADDLGTSDVHVRTMRSRGIIPPQYWPALISAARRRCVAGINSTSLMWIYADTKAARRRDQAAAEGGAA